jgi:peptidoglycan biosynthesis protein MviN/MurJ (putative lipid II flippase)
MGFAAVVTSHARLLRSPCAATGAPALKTNISIGSLVAMQLVLAVVMQVLVIRIIGSGAATDAYVAALALPLILQGIVAVALQSVWLPQLATATTADWPRLVRIALGQTLLWFGGAALAIGLTAPLWAPLLFPGFGPEQLALTNRLLVMMLPGAVCSGAFSLLAVAGRSRSRFLLVEALPLATAALATLLTPLALRWLGIDGAAWLLTLRHLASALLLWLVLRPGLPIFASSPERRAATRSARLLLAGASIYKLSPLVDRFWTSQGPVGSLTLYNLAIAGAGAVTTVLERAISTPVIPSLSRLWQAGDLAGFRKRYRGVVVRIFGLMLPATLVLVLLRDPAILLAGGVLAIAPAKAVMVFWIGVALVGTIIAGAAGSTAASAFYAMGDTVTPVRIGIAGFVLGLGLKAVGFLAFGVVGLALGASAYYMLNLAVMVIILERRLNERDAAGRSA